MYRRLVIIICMLLIAASGLYAQEYKVVSFRHLPNDVTAFMTPVRDNNDEACALIKVQAPKEFAFSTPMGIVKRVDEVGEIWLYVPSGTKSMTLKHPHWGVLRDYRFTRKLEGHSTYEMVLQVPQQPVEVMHDTVTMVKTVTDTISISLPTERTLLHLHALATVAFHNNGPSYGVMLALMRKNGAYFHVQSSLSGSVNTQGECDDEGREIGKSGNAPYYSGAVSTNAMRLTAGVVQRLSSSLSIFEGAGYGNGAVAWQLTDSDGGVWLKNKDLSYSGVALEVGCIYSIVLPGKGKRRKAVDVSLSTSTIAGSHWQFCAGIGVRL